MLSRRHFIQRSVASVAAASIFGLPSFGQSPSYLTFDFHTHPGLFPMKGAPAYGGDAGVVKTVGEMNTGKLSGGFFSLVADAPLIKMGPTGVTSAGSYGPGEGWKEYKRQMGILKEFLSKLPVVKATKASDLKLGQQQGKVAAFISSEGGDFLEGNADRLDEMYADGVRSVQIVHYHPNELGDLQTEPSKFQGLSKEGKAVIKQMNKLKMLIDVAHASEQTVWGVVDLTDSPIILSHSLLKIDDTRPLSKRTLSPDHAKLIAKTDGVIGAWPSGHVTSFDEFIDSVKRLVDVVGVDHVGLGTDMDGNFKPVISSYLQMPQWIDGLKAKGFSESDVKKIVGGNAERVLTKVIG